MIPLFSLQFQQIEQRLTGHKNIGIILLAAGSSSRMGYNKLLSRIKGNSLLENATLAAIGSNAQNVLVVLGANANENQDQLRSLNVIIVENRSWISGIGSSIKCGLKEILSLYRNIDAVIISVCDQPYLSTKVFNKLMTKYTESGSKIVGSAYSGSIGVPVLFDKSNFSDLLNLPDEYGAKKYVLDIADKGGVATIPFPKGNVDIDTIKDLLEIHSNYNDREIEELK